jgi:hypothetical protein
MKAKVSNAEASLVWQNMTDADKEPYKHLSLEEREELKRLGRWSRSSTYIYVTISFKI